MSSKAPMPESVSDSSVSEGMERSGPRVRVWSVGICVFLRVSKKWLMFGRERWFCNTVR